MNDTMNECLRKLRNKWCDDLEDLLQCTICMLCPANVAIHQCVEGHLVCENCKLRLPRCPTCAKEWSIYRNRLAESMCLTFEDIKSSLIDPEAKINELLIPDKFCVATQTENDVGNGATAVTAVVAAPKTIAPAPVDPAGAYPCCIGQCRVKTSFELLVQHMKQFHPLDYTEIPLGRELLFEHSLFMIYVQQPMSCDRVFRIRDVGAFVVKLSSDAFGGMRGYVMMIHCGVAAKQFSYQLKLSYGGNFIGSVYTDNVYSCRSPATIFEEQCLRVTREDILRMTAGVENPMIECTVRLARKFDDTQTLRMNETKKKRPPRNPKIVNLPLFI